MDDERFDGLLRQVLAVMECRQRAVLHLEKLRQACGLPKDEPLLTTSLVLRDMGCAMVYKDVMRTGTQLAAFAGCTEAEQEDVRGKLLRILIEV